MFSPLQASVRERSSTRPTDRLRVAARLRTPPLSARSQRQPSVSDARQRCKGRCRSFRQTR